MPKEPYGFEIKVIMYVHRVLLVLFLATLIVAGCSECFDRIQRLHRSTTFVPLTR